MARMQTAVSASRKRRYCAFQVGRKLHAVEHFRFAVQGWEYKVVNHHSSVLSPGCGKILEFDDRSEDIAADGVSLVLHDNV